MSSLDGLKEKIYLGLVHHPVYNKEKKIVTTSVTNLDIHDIARSCKTFGIERYYLITPIKLQQELVLRILDHWKTHKSLAYNPDRKNALSLSTIKDRVEDVILEISEFEGKRPFVAVTGANFKMPHGSIENLQKLIKQDKRPLLLLFGTGYGLAQDLVDSADYLVSPVQGPSTDGYNHLSVRSAVAIYLWRLCGKV